MCACLQYAILCEFDIFFDHLLWKPNGMNSLFCFLCSKSDICDNLFRKWIRRSMRNCPNLIKVVTLNVGHYFFLLSLILADRRHARPNTVKRPYDTVIHFDHYGGSTHSAYYCLRRRVVLAWVWVRISEAHAAEINKQATIVIYARWIWKSQTTEGEEATTLRFFFSTSLLFTRSSLVLKRKRY